MLRLGIDTGGTFTDVVACDDQTGERWTTKVASTPVDPSLGFMAGVERILNLAGCQAHQIASVAHGTTVATNALLAEEGSFPGLGLIVTRGFRALLEIARQSTGTTYSGAEVLRESSYGNSYFWVKPERIVPLHRVREVTERVDFRGQVVTPLDLDDASAAAVWFRDRAIECIGVCFLHAYARAEHEQRMREVLTRIHPNASVSISSEVLPEYREYERAVTTLVDAFVKPRVSRYVSQIETRLHAQLGPATPFYLMKSNGGVVSAREVAHSPISTLLSGPAAGALGAAMLADVAGFAKVLTLDGGGTSTDVAVVERGTPHLTTQGRVGRFPVKVPMTDVVTVGAGGGSIGRRAPDGRLRVGPDSAGADPGPMCYGQGGREPTVTDASLILGRVPPHLLGGEIPLDLSRAQQGIAKLGASLGLDPYRTAAGILEIAAWSQANAVRQVTVKRGLDVRDYVLVAFGGSGPLQAGKLVDLLDLRSALVPPDPGNVSAFGLLTVDVKNDFVATAVQRDDLLDLDALNAAFARLESQARGALVAEGFAPQVMRVTRAADMRYFGQAWEVRVEVPAGPIDRACADLVVERFHAAHQQTYGYSYATSPDQRIEWVNARVVAIGPIQRPVIRARPRSLDGGVERACTGRRAVYFDPAFVDTPIFDRRHLQPEDCVAGPAVIEEFGSTTVVFPGMRASIDAYANLRLTRAT